jgi:putative cardiolipin synthase
MRILTLRLLLLLVALLGACASLPPPPPSPPAYAYTDVGDTRLAQVAAAAVPAHPPGLSGFRLLPEGPTALNARIALAQRAERSLDVQYYLIGNDATGRRFLRALRDASTRGVRVRLLVDDLFTGGEDELLAGLAAYPNVQVRLFNPLPSRAASTGARLLNSLHEFSRINHRMHNKLCIADNSFAVSGGRNIADEYFMHGAAANFIDLDVLSCGPVCASCRARSMPTGTAGRSIPSTASRPGRPRSASTSWWRLRPRPSRSGRATCSATRR